MEWILEMLWPMTFSRITFIFSLKQMILNERFLCYKDSNYSLRVASFWRRIGAVPYQTVDLPKNILFISRGNIFGELSEKRKFQRGRNSEKRGCGHGHFNRFNAFEIILWSPELQNFTFFQSRSSFEPFEKFWYSDQVYIGEPRTAIFGPVQS